MELSDASSSCTCSYNFVNNSFSVYCEKPWCSHITEITNQICRLGLLFDNLENPGGVWWHLAIPVFFLIRCHFCQFFNNLVFEARFWVCSISGLSGGSEGKGEKEDAAAGVLVPSSPELRHREAGLLAALHSQLHAPSHRAATLRKALVSQICWRE